MTGGGTQRLMRMAVLGLALGLCRAIPGASQQPDRAIINANGTWRIGADAAGDNAEKSRGKWTARFQIDPSGALTGTIALEGMGNGTPAEIEGTVDGNQIKFGLVSTRADTPAGK
ncbi:MAG: hypothetical protein HY699_17410, partial [Deltaproteobacteria bacterium]|nr:hypothetical protein [Deltaproteobacteria bacterium]